MEDWDSERDQFFSGSRGCVIKENTYFFGPNFSLI